jgi:hypothetical protein
MGRTVSVPEALQTFGALDVSAGTTTCLNAGSPEDLAVTLAEPKAAL